LPRILSMQNRKQTEVISFLIYFLASVSALAQKTLTGHVIDQQGSPVPYANVHNVSRSHGVVADSSGAFVYYNKENSDTLIVSALSYTSERIVVGSNTTLKIILKEKSIAINEVKVSNRRVYKVNTFGINKNKPDGKHSNCTQNNLELSFLVKSEPVSDNSYIDKVVFFIENDRLYNTPFRVKIYSNKSNLPNELVIHDNIVVHALNPGWAVVDLRPYAIKTPSNGFHIAMEWLYADSDDLKDVQGNKICFGQSIGMAKGLKEIRNCLGSPVEATAQNAG